MRYVIPLRHGQRQGDFDMFALARGIVRHKVGAIAVIGIAAFAMMPSADEEAETSSSPWGKQAPGTQVAKADEGGFIDDIVSEADSMLAESGMDPREKAAETVDRFDNTANAFSNANRK